MVGGFDVAQNTMLMAELHGVSRMNLTHGLLTVNAGVRHEITETGILIVPLGHEICSHDLPRALLVTSECN